MKPWDVFVDDQQKAYVLGRMPTENSSALMTQFVLWQAHMVADTQTIGGKYSYGMDKFIYDLDGNNDVKIPYHLRTGQQTLNIPTIPKRFYGIKFYSEHYQGELHVRVYIDDKYVCDGRVVPYLNSTKAIMINLPNNRNIGYSIDVEVAGTVPLRAFEFLYDEIETTLIKEAHSVQNSPPLPNGPNSYRYSYGGT
jgi:hypothetical protein